MKSFVIIPLLTVAAYAQTQSPLIPSGISDGCKNYLVSLDSNADILSFTKAFTNVAANFGVGSNSGNASASAITSTLNSFCSSLSANVVRAQLAPFLTACSNELSVTHNADVIRIYDVLYTIFPMSKAVCTKYNGTYCVLQSTSKSPASSSANDLWLPWTSNKSRPDEQDAIIPNLEKFKKDNLVLLGIQPSFPGNQSCTPCTRNVLNEYIPLISDIGYGPGTANGVLVGSVLDLYATVQNQCPPDFLGGTVQAAGGISGGILGSGAADLSVNTRTVAGALSAMILGFFIAL